MTCDERFRSDQNLKARHDGIRSRDRVEMSLTKSRHHIGKDNCEISPSAILALYQPRCHPHPTNHTQLIIWTRAAATATAQDGSLGHVRLYQ